MLAFDFQTHSLAEWKCKRGFLVNPWKIWKKRYSTDLIVASSYKHRRREPNRIGIYSDAFLFLGGETMDHPAAPGDIVQEDQQYRFEMMKQ